MSANPVKYRVFERFCLDRKVYKGVLTISNRMCLIERDRPAIGYTSGNKPDSVSLARGKTGKSPSYYIKKALKSANIREKEKRLLRSLLHAFEEGNYGAGVKSFTAITILLLSETYFSRRVRMHLLISLKMRCFLHRIHTKHGLRKDL